MASSGKRALEVNASLSGARGRPLKRQATDIASSSSDLNNDSWHQMVPSIGASFSGSGIQNSGTGKIKVGGNVVIGTPTNSQCLADLRSTDPRHDKERIEETKGGLLKDSYRWILENPQFLAWRNEPERRLLWIRGDPGKGKTMLMCGIIDELKNNPCDTTMAFFFCQATDVRLNNATAVLRGLIYHLISQHGHLISYLEAEYQRAGKALFEDVNSWFALAGILTTMLQDPALKEVCLIVDAIDECDFGHDRLLDFIVRTKTSHRTRWIVSSRNWPTIEEKLESGSQQVGLSLELNQEHVAGAVRNYIRYKVERLAQLKKYTREIHHDVELYLVTNADDTFLWVALVCQALANVAAWRASETIKIFPRSLNALYDRMMDQVQASDDAELCKQVLAAASVTYRPVKLVELYRLVEFPPDWSEDTDFLQGLIRFCGSFLTLRDSTVYFVHQSAKEFLQKEAADKVFANGIPWVHFEIYSRSLTVMSSTLRRDIYRVGKPGCHVLDFARPDPDPLLSSSYSCVYWLDHLCDAIPDEDRTTTPADENRMIHFFKTYYLNWLEALALLDKLAVGLLSLSKLSGLIKVCFPLESWLSLFSSAQQARKETEYGSIIQDALRFIQYHKPCIERYPLQVYISVLVFSPAQSIIRRSYSREKPPKITITPTVKDDWGPCSQTIEAHEDQIIAVVYSPDGKLLASRAHDGSINIRDTILGTITQLPNAGGLLRGGPFQHNMAFSPKGGALAYSFKSYAIKIWDVAKSVNTQTFESMPHIVRLLAYLPDGRRLASSSGNYTVQIWDIALGILAQNFEFPHGGICSMTSRPDGLILASQLADNTLGIWNIDKGDRIQTFELFESSCSIDFWDDSRRVVMRVYDNQVAIQDSVTLPCIARVFPESSHAVSVALSPDGQTLALSVEGYTIKTLDLVTRKIAQTFEGHTSVVRALAFSADGSTLASGSNDGIIKIWDVGTARHYRPTMHDSRYDENIVLSLDGRFVALLPESGLFIEIWDAATGKHIHTLRASEGQECSGEFPMRFSSMNFSSRCHHLFASGFDDGTVKIWDLAKVVCTRTLRGYHSPVFSTAFLDDELLVSTSVHGCIDVWDSNSTRVKRFHERHDRISCIAFSSDGCRMAIQPNHGKMYVRDTRSIARIQSLEGLQVSRATSAAFSPRDGRMLAAVIWDREGDRWIHVWDTSTGACLLKLRIIWGAQIHEFETERFLRTTLGTIDLSSYGLGSETDRTSDSPQSQLPLMSERYSKPCFLGYGIDAKGVWITRDSVNVLWLPPEYRPRKLAVAGKTVVLLDKLGHVSMVRFSPDSII